jgi:hypothetical protein
MSAVMVGTTGCKKKEGCTDPASLNYDPDAKFDDGTCEYPGTGELGFHFHPMAGTVPFQFGTEFTTTEGRKIKFDIARFFVSNVRLLRTGGGELLVPDEYLHINASIAEYALEGEIPVGSYEGVKFDVGIDDASNTADPSSWPAGHALSSSSSTFDHWSWNTGYLFIRLEGMVDTTVAMSATANVHFEYHIGLERSRREVAITEPFDVTWNGDNEIHLEVDYLDFLEDLDLTTDISTHTMDDSLTAARIANRVTTAIVPEAE